MGTGNLNGTGNTLANTLVGNAGANRLDGDAGADAMTGGAGNDTYVVDNAADSAVEVALGGTDTIQSSISWTLGAEIENLTLTGAAAINGTGNALANVLTGNAADNVLNGGAGVDTLIGGLGNDTYVVDVVGDVTTEAASAGTDTVQSSVSWTLGSNLESLTLTGSALIDATGNTLANVLTGNAANNILSGLAGADTMIGGLGNDTYVVDNALDVVTEAASAGTDLVQAGVSFVLSANVENLTLTGASAINATGNSLANVLIGNAAANRLDGGSGADAMTAGAGNDVYVVDNAGDTTIELAAGGLDAVESSITWTLGRRAREPHADRNERDQRYGQRSRQRPQRQRRQQPPRRRRSATTPWSAVPATTSTSSTLRPTSRPRSRSAASTPSRRASTGRWVRSSRS